MTLSFVAGVWVLSQECPGAWPHLLLLTFASCFQIWCYSSSVLKFFFFFSKAQQGGMWLTWHLGPLGVGCVSWKIRIIHLFWCWGNDIRFSVCQKKCCVWLLRIHAENWWSKELHQTPRCLSVFLCISPSATCLSVYRSICHLSTYHSSPLYCIWWNLYLIPFSFLSDRIYGLLSTFYIFALLFLSLKRICY